MVRLRVFLRPNNGSPPDPGERALVVRPSHEPPPRLASEASTSATRSALLPSSSGFLGRGSHPKPGFNGSEDTGVLPPATRLYRFRNVPR